MTCLHNSAFLRMGGFRTSGRYTERNCLPLLHIFMLRSLFNITHAKKAFLYFPVPDRNIDIKECLARKSTSYVRRGTVRHLLLGCLFGFIFVL